MHEPASVEFLHMPYRGNTIITDRLTKTKAPMKSKIDKTTYRDFCGIW